MSTQELQQQTTVWNIDAAHSLAEFTVRHMMITKVRGRFPEVEGTIRVDEAEPENSSVRVRIDATSIDTGQEDRDAHLRSGDFFDVERYPALTFESTRVEGLRLEPGTGFTVWGDLTIHGVTKEVELSAVYEGGGTDPWGGDRVSFAAETEIDRRDFGLEWNQALETGGVLVGHEVKIHLEAQAV
ncbi:MAG: YceI family protein, partial [Gemmatimonadetes bacterium]|nr:YceI family protein [Gemmatimonadota bacterium]NIR76993.1 YceI family protein [Gemmatimonadota bacterium]NIU30231.1 YceI family protein [Gemmatimonadota bacterium]NIV60625.1 polyisoprenoid-binding protein [Gemmatimonadota bacterium]NIW63302.1 polyisoprenoid-binding protein [Gemmatimonadota bacterium]